MQQTLVLLLLLLLLLFWPTSTKPVGTKTLRKWNNIINIIIIDIPSSSGEFLLTLLGKLRPIGSTASGLSWNSARRCVLGDWDGDELVVTVDGKTVPWVDDVLKSVSTRCGWRSGRLRVRDSASSLSRRRRECRTPTAPIAPRRLDTTTENWQLDRH